MKERINWIDWAKALAVCSVVFCHLPQSQEWFYYRYLQALTMVVFIFISGYLNKQASKVECGKTTPIVTVHNGIDIRRSADAKPINRSVIGMDENDFIVFYSGKPTKEKGRLELIQAFIQINTIPNLKLIIAGASFYGKDSQVTPYIMKLQKESEDIKEQVVFTGFVDYCDMPSYLKTANVVVISNNYLNTIQKMLSNNQEI